MINCGSNCYKCFYPVNLNTYSGCSHGCKYCYAAKQKDMTTIKPLSSEKEVADFVKGIRHKIVSWADWDIPLRIGTDCDPLQPCEMQYRETFKCLKILEEAHYPYIITTKGRLVSEEPYLSIFANSECVVQISMVCPSYNKYETGSPSFDERVESIRKLSHKGVRVLARVQPILITHEKEIIDNLYKIADAGAYGIICGGYWAKNYHNGMEKIGGTYYYKNDVLMRCYFRIRKKCHELGIKFITEDKYIRPFLSDDENCCGTDGLDAFHPNTFVESKFYAGENVTATEGMKKCTGYCFRHASQDTVFGNWVSSITYEEYVRLHFKEWKDDYFENLNNAKKTFIILNSREDNSKL